MSYDEAFDIFESKRYVDGAVAIKSNAPYGDDHEPTYTAPAGVSDIECLYTDFGLSCEVTTLTGRDQWFNEGQPVMRHLRDFENKNNDVENFCLFIAPKIHQDTLNTFWIAVKHEYEGKKQKIIPITISMLIKILDKCKLAKEQNHKVTANEMKNFYINCTNVDNLNNSFEWYDVIKEQVEKLQFA